MLNFLLPYSYNTTAINILVISFRQYLPKFFLLYYKKGVMLGGHVRAVFTLVTFIFIGCVAVTLNSFREIPLWRLQSASENIILNDEGDDVKATSNEQSALNEKLQPSDPINRTASYGALSNQNMLSVPNTAVSIK